MSNESSPSGSEVMSPNRRALEAITAFIQGRATSQQRRVQIGDKSVEYSSLSELLQWKRYFEEEVRKDEGKRVGIRHEKIFFQGRV